MRGKENLATLSRFLPWARVESPLATVYWTHANIHGNEGPPWEATPSSRAFFVLVGGVRVLEISRRKGEDLWEKFSFDPLRCSYHRQRFLNWFLCLAKSSSTLGKRTIPRSFGSVLIRMFIRKLLELHLNGLTALNWSLLLYEHRLSLSRVEFDSVTRAVKISRLSFFGVVCNQSIANVYI